MKPLNHPVTKVTIPSTKEEITIRPFTVGEEKITLFSSIRDEPDEEKVNNLIDSITQVINNCILTDGIDINNYPLFDIVYVFIKLRSISVSRFVELVWTDRETGEEFPFKLNLGLVEVKYHEDHSDKIILDSVNNIGIQMRYPTMKELAAFDETEEDSPELYRAIAGLIKCYWVGDDVEYLGKDYTVDDAYDLLMSMTNIQLGQVTKFFDTLPVIQCRAEVLKKNGEVHSFVIDEVAYFLL